jgi:hypothetical protein
MGALLLPNAGAFEIVGVDIFELLRWQFVVELALEYVVATTQILRI